MHIYAYAVLQFFDLETIAEAWRSIHLGSCRINLNQICIFSRTCSDEIGEFLLLRPCPTRGRRIGKFWLDFIRDSSNAVKAEDVTTAAVAKKVQKL